MLRFFYINLQNIYHQKYYNLEFNLNEIVDPINLPVQIFIKNF